ncbi:uncharacterized protein LOC112683763 [Sipha flava]|uniref:Uncharacterized protein LOC112683763 n=1 Tax=Sipha flava TaxID=143950 RepID=A0A8B8FJP1_9HEMI|nr:uncharacterized protein LOC112683763 [Sipha flava]
MHDSKRKVTHPAVTCTTAKAKKLHARREYVPPARSVASVAPERDANTTKSAERKSHVVKNHMNLEDHRKCLFGEAGVELYRENVSIRSFNHQLMTISTKKLTYNSYDDKKHTLEDKVHTLAHGHYRIVDAELADMMSDTGY